MKDDNMLVQHSSAGVTAAERVLPKHFRAGFGPRITELLAVGVTVAMRAQNLWPIAGLSCASAKTEHCRGSNEPKTSRHIYKLRSKCWQLLYWRITQALLVICKSGRFGTISAFVEMRRITYDLDIGRVQ